MNNNQLLSPSSNSRIAKNVLFLYARMLLLMIIGFLTSRVVLDRLGEVDYGLYNVVASLTLLFSFVQGALSSSASRFIAYEIGVGTFESQRKIFCMAMNIHLIFSAIVLLAAETVGLWYFEKYMVIPAERHWAAFVVYQLSCLNAILSIIVIPYMSTIISYEQMKSFAYLSIIEGGAKLFIAFCLYIDGVDKLILYASLLFIVQVLTNLLYYLYCRRHFLAARFKKYWDTTLFKDMAAFGGWTACTYLSSSFVEQIYNLMLNLFFGPTVNAARAVAYQVQTNITKLVQNFQIAINPQIIKNYAINDNHRVIELARLSVSVSFSLLLIIMYPILVNIDAILGLWLVDVPDNTGAFVSIICISAVFSSMANSFSVVVGAANRLKLYNLTTLPVYFIAIPIAFFALKNGASASIVFVVTAVAEFIALWIKIFITGIVMKTSLRDEFILVLKCILSMLLFVVLALILRKLFSTDLIGTIVSLTTCMSLSILWSAYVILTKTERKVVYTKIKNHFFKNNNI